MKRHLELVLGAEEEPMLYIGIKIAYRENQTIEKLNQYQADALIKEIEEATERYRIDLLSVQRKYEKMVT